MLESLEGIVIKERDYGDTSKIIEVFTKKYGIVSMIAKGAKNPKSNLYSCTSRLTFGNFFVYYKPSKLSTLSLVDILDPLKEIKKDIIKVNYASYICELTEQVIKQVPNNDIVDIYDLMLNTLKKINEKFDEVVLTNIIELKYLDYLGVAPVLDSCSSCGRKDLIATISVQKYGLLCKECIGNEKIKPLDVIKYIRMYYFVDITKITKLEVNPLIKKEIDFFLKEYYEKHTGLYLNTKRIIDIISV